MTRDDLSWRLVCGCPYPAQSHDRQQKQDEQRDQNAHDVHRTRPRIDAPMCVRIRRRRGSGCFRSSGCHDSDLVVDAFDIDSYILEHVDHCDTAIVCPGVPVSSVAVALIEMYYLAAAERSRTQVSKRSHMASSPDAESAITSAPWTMRMVASSLANSFR